MQRDVWSGSSAAGVLLAGVLLTAMSGCAERDRPTLPAYQPSARALARPTRAVWVARMHYRYADDVRTIMRNCAALGFNTVLWQVRGNGTVTYPSQLEPWSREFDHREPGYDPLRLAVEEAHAHGLRIEAWVNVMPGWKGRNPPPMQAQLYHQHPEWFLHDAAGRQQPLGDFYVILNPCLPEVRRHIAAVCEEIATNYDVDGLHLDYVRYAWDTTPKASQIYPRDARTLALYRRATGKLPDEDSAAWDRWRADQLSHLVGDIRRMLHRCRPGATLTAAVWRHPHIAYKNFLQDSAGWLKRGVVDALMPMAYTKSVDQFVVDVHAYQLAAPQGRVIPGIGIYMHEVPVLVHEQLDRCASWGGDVAIFSYASLHATDQDRRQRDTKRAAQERALREMRRSALLEWFHSERYEG